MTHRTSYSIWTNDNVSRRFLVPGYAVLPAGSLKLRSERGVVRAVDPAFVAAFEVDAAAAGAHGGANAEAWAALLERLRTAEGTEGLGRIVSVLGQVLADGTSPEAGRRAAAAEQMASLNGLLATLGIELGGALDDLPDRLAALRAQFEATNDAGEIADRLDRLAGEVADAAPALAEVVRRAAAKFRPEDGAGPGGGDGEPKD
jgi:hypothetical protein